MLVQWERSTLKTLNTKIREVTQNIEQSQTQCGSRIVRDMIKTMVTSDKLATVN